MLLYYLRIGVISPRSKFSAFWLLLCKTKSQGFTKLFTKLILLLCLWLGYCFLSWLMLSGAMSQDFTKLADLVLMSLLHHMQWYYSEAGQQGT